MAVSITIGGITLRLLPGFQQRASEWRGSVDRAFDMSLVDGRDSEKRSWSGVTDWMTTTEEAALRAAVASGPVVCSGLVLPGGPFTCSVEVESSSYGPAVQSGLPDYTGVNVTLALTLREA
jgi:hypothetical protein